MPLTNSGRMLFAQLATCLASLGAFVGCSKPPYDMAPVRGQVVVDGRPLTTGRVMFAPRSSNDRINVGKPAFGRIDSEGKYVLSTYANQDGAVVGEHLVTISFSPRRSQAGESDAGAKYILNGRSVRSLNVPGSFSVSPGQENEIDLSLSSDEISKYARFDE